MNLVFASNNQNKIIEISRLLPSFIFIKSLNDINCLVDIPETGTTLEKNALLKARYITQHYHLNAFADDSGLEVEALNNAPGVYSARYAGDDKSDANNIHKLLKELSDVSNRKARFRTVIALVINNNEYFFEGIINGSITTEIIGNNGFGYDPVFIPNAYTKTFAQMNLDEKNKMSHRAIATNKLVEFLKTYTEPNE